MKLCDLRVLKLRFVCRFRGSFLYSRASFPNLLRGCFGNAVFKSGNNAVRALYEELFKPEIEDPLTDRYNDVPKPFVLNPFLMRKKIYNPGDTFELGINLFGPFTQCPEIISQAFCEMGRLGFADGNAPFDVKEAFICHNPDKLIFNTGKRIGIDFISPLQIRERGKYIRKPEFSSIFRRIYGRIRNLIYFYENEELEEDMSYVSNLLPEIRIFSCFMEKTENSFRIPKEGVKQRFDGMEGRIVYEFPSEKDADMFLPWLSKGMSVHIGKNTSWGMGAYTFSVLN